MPTHALQLSQLHIGRRLLVHRLCLALLAAAVIQITALPKANCGAEDDASPASALLQQSTERKSEDREYAPTEDVKDAEVQVEDIDMASTANRLVDLQTDMLPSVDVQTANQRSESLRLPVDEVVDLDSGSTSSSSSDPVVASSSDRTGFSSMFPSMDSFFNDSLAMRVVINTGPPDEAGMEKKDMKKMMKEEGLRLLRPHAGKAPEVVGIGVFVKQFRGVKLVDKSFDVDLVLTTRWIDKRTNKFLTKGAKLLTIPTKVARKLIWTPDISLTNRAPKGLDVISSVVRIESSGVVQKIDRVKATLLQKYVIDAFPFDKQYLDIKISTFSAGEEQVDMKALKERGVTGTAPDAFEHRQYKYFSHHIDSGTTGGTNTIKKTFVHFQLVVKHQAGGFFSSTFAPGVAIAAVANAALLVPCDNPAFLMPRIALSFLSYLMSVVFASQIDHLQPDRRHASWLDIWQQSLQLCVYMNVVFTIIIAYTVFWRDLPQLGKKFDEELIVLMPVLTTVMILLCAGFIGQLGYIELLHEITGTILMGFFVGYIISMVIRMRTHRLKGVGAAKVADPSPPVQQATVFSSPPITQAPALSAPPVAQAKMLSEPLAYPDSRVGLPVPAEQRSGVPAYPEHMFTGYAGSPMQSPTSVPQSATAIPVQVEHVSPPHSPTSRSAIPVQVESFGTAPDSSAAFFHAAPYDTPSSTAQQGMPVSTPSPPTVQQGMPVGSHQQGLIEVY